MLRESALAALLLTSTGCDDASTDPHAQDFGIPTEAGVGGLDDAFVPRAEVDAAPIDTPLCIERDVIPALHNRFELLCADLEGTPDFDHRLVIAQCLRLTCAESDLVYDNGIMAGVTCKMLRETIQAAKESTGPIAEGGCVDTTVQLGFAPDPNNFPPTVSGDECPTVCEGATADVCQGPRSPSRCF
ncbi:hypothetical protein CO046_02055 [Candidatus Peregrinibacteria bacterium CG_4_9_14_0_2_um_filter_53_11]|nr:MAG: hypothetical protein CO046_02055 [Candidatus Peregrinibacteria bacterium CG_4_9_14_0_2_um_filter_53_11]